MLIHRSTTHSHTALQHNKTCPRSNIDDATARSLYNIQKHFPAGKSKLKTCFSPPIKPATSMKDKMYHDRLKNPNPNNSMYVRGLMLYLLEMLEPITKDPEKFRNNKYEHFCLFSMFNGCSSVYLFTFKTCINTGSWILGIYSSLKSF